jgi:uncharacterized membrane protein YgcG
MEQQPMHHEQVRARQVRAKTQQVMDYHYDDGQPGKPLYLLVPGGLIALVSLVLIAWITYRAYYADTLDPASGLPMLLVLAPIYIGGVFLFSYGYELYDLPRALRDTAIIVFLTVAAVVIVAVLLVLAGSLGSGKSSSSSKSSSGKSSRSRSSASSSRSSNGGSWGDIGPIFVGGSGTRTVTREVVREVPVERAEPEPVTCPNCGRMYLAAENQFICPSCGAPAPAPAREAHP